jgi:nicotinate-nucleotide adenylyltransferase
MVKGFFGGSYNPVHNGHIALARAVVARGLADRVMMVLSPLNPLKQNPEELIADELRLEMLRRACAPYSELEVSDIELSMPRPSYTINTLRRLSADDPSTTFRLIIGGDNMACFKAWRGWDELIRDYAPIVYPRQGFQTVEAAPGLTPLNAELLPISSTQVRQLVAAGKPIAELVPPAVEAFIREHSLYQTATRPS